MITELRKPTDHNSYHCDMQQGGAVLRLDFIVTAQPAMAHEPAKSTLHNPALEEHGEAALPLALGRHLQAQGACSAMAGYPGRKFFSTVALVSPQAAQPATATQDGAQKVHGCFPLRHIGRGHANPQQ